MLARRARCVPCILPLGDVIHINVNADLNLPSTVNNQVNNDVLAEEIPVLERDLHGSGNI